MAGLRQLCLRGAQMQDWLPAVAGLRIQVFRDFPYLYQGDSAYEQRYLATYSRSPDSLLLLLLDGEQVVGASTGLPLADEEPDFQQPFLDAGLPVDGIFYCGESVLLPTYRGQGYGHRFFDAREAHARNLGRFAWSAFAAVDRPADHPARPQDYRGHEAFWRRRGYERRPELCMSLAWKELGQSAETAHALTFWLRPLS